MPASLTSMRCPTSESPKSLVSYQSLCFYDINTPKPSHWNYHSLALSLNLYDVSWWYLPKIWPSVTDMQHYYHARYPTDDWHLAYMFSLIYFSVEACLVGLFPHSVKSRQDPCVRVYAPLMLATPLARKQNLDRGVTRFNLIQARGHLNWHLGLPALLGGNLGCWIV